MRVFLGVPARAACRCVIAVCFVLFQSTRHPPISRESNQLSGLLVLGDGKQAKEAKSARNRKMFAAAGFPFSLEPFARLHHFYNFVPISPFFSSSALHVFLLPDFARALWAHLSPPPPKRTMLSISPSSSFVPFSPLFSFSPFFPFLPISPRTLHSSLFLSIFLSFRPFFSFPFTRSSPTLLLPGGFHPSYSPNRFYRLRCATGLTIIFREGFTC